MCSTSLALHLHVYTLACRKKWLLYFCHSKLIKLKILCAETIQDGKTLFIIITHLIKPYQHEILDIFARWCDLKIFVDIHLRGNYILYTCLRAFVISKGCLWPWKGSQFHDTRCLSLLHFEPFRTRFWEFICPFLVNT